MFSHSEAQYDVSKKYSNVFADLCFILLRKRFHEAVILMINDNKMIIKMTLGCYLDVYEPPWCSG